MRWSDKDGITGLCISSKGEERIKNRDGWIFKFRKVERELLTWNGHSSLHVPSPPLARNLPSPEENVRAFTHEL